MERANRHLNLHVFISHVVIGELLFLKFNDLSSKVCSFESNLRFINELTKQNILTAPDLDELQKIVVSELDAWIKANNVIILETPHPSKVRWLDWIDEAIWKILPFSKGDLNDKFDKKEKGFKDSLILEAFLEMCKGGTDDSLIYFVSEDKEFQQTVKMKCESDKRCQVKTNIVELETELDGYIAMIKDNILKDTINDLVDIAFKTFFDPSDIDSLFYKSAQSTIYHDYGDFLNNPNKTLLEQFFLRSTEDTQIKDFQEKFLRAAWHPIADGIWYVGKPSFVKRENSNTYFWKSFAGFYKPYNIPSFEQFMYPSNIKRLHHLQFEITWFSEFKSYCQMLCMGSIRRRSFVA